MASTLAAALMLAPGIGDAPGAAAAECPRRLQSYLTRLGFSGTQMAALRSGSVVAVRLTEKDDNAAFVVGVVRVAATEEALAAEIRGMGQMRWGARVMQTGRFGTPPGIRDVESLVLEAGDLEDLRHCRAGKCDLKADTDMLAIAREVDWSAPDGVALATRLFKQALVARVQSYLERGAGGMAVYRDDDPPASSAAEFARILESSPHLVARDPEFYRYLLEFPDAGPPRVESFVYWSKERLRKPVVSLVHACLEHAERGGDPGYVIALKHIYDSRFFLAYAEFLETVPDSPAGDGFYLVRSVRARIDPPRWFRGFLLGKIKRAMRNAMAADLERARRRLEDRGPRPPFPLASRHAFVHK